MNKHTFIFSVFVLSFVFSNVALAKSPCESGDLFSFITGERCINIVTIDESEVVSSLRLLVVGSVGDDVKAVQRILKNEGYSLGKVDGNYGKRTARAIRDFQYDNDLAVTGSVNIETWEKLNAVRGDVVIPRFCENGTTSYPYCKDQTITISGIEGPQSLNINEQGTWTVKASDSSGGSLSYSVVWGDEVAILGEATSIAPMKTVYQTATFPHSYSRAGIFKPIFTVRNSAGQSAQTSLSVNVKNSRFSSITVTNPNRGETWIKGAMQTIKWKDNTPPPQCAYDRYVPCLIAPRYYDIKLVQNSSCNYPATCLTYHPAPYTIAKSVYGSSYEWSVGSVWLPGHIGGAPESPMFAPDGSYYIQICQADSNVCDSSDSHFNITSIIID